LAWDLKAGRNGDIPQVMGSFGLLLLVFVAVYWWSLHVRCDEFAFL